MVNERVKGLLEAFSGLPSLQKRILKLLRGKGPLPTREVASKLKSDSEIVREELWSLRKEGWVVLLVDSELPPWDWRITENGIQKLLKDP